MAGSDGASHHQDSPTSASLARAERQIKQLQDENKQLKTDLADISSLYQQLTRENDQEHYDERRINFLKSQLIQLERQVLLLSEALSSRAGCLLEAENAMAHVADSCRDRMADKKQNQISFSREELKLLVETCESARIKLFKNIETNTTETLGRPLLFMDKFVKSNFDNPVTLIDVCKSDTKHINLKHVARLESQLSQLYGRLSGLSAALHCLVDPEYPQAANTNLPNVVYTRLTNQVIQACNLLNDVAPQLLQLSVLVPAAPWRGMQQPWVEDLSVDTLLSRLPSFPKARQPAARSTLQALLRAGSYSQYMAKKQMTVLQEELAFHQAVYSLQHQYVQDLLNATRSGYANFEEETNDLLCKPLSALLASYEKLHSSASEGALKDFLTCFKDLQPQLSAAVGQLKQQPGKGDEALSQYGQEFLQTISQVKGQLEQKRDSMMCDLEEIKQGHEKALAEVREMFPPEPKTPASTVPSPGGQTPKGNGTPGGIEEELILESPSRSGETTKKIPPIDCSCSNSNGTPRVGPLKGVSSSRGKDPTPARGPRILSPQTPHSGSVRRLKPPSGNTPSKGTQSGSPMTARPMERRPNDVNGKPGSSTPVAKRPSSLPRRSLSIPRLQLKPITPKRIDEAAQRTDSPADSPPEKPGDQD